MSLDASTRCLQCFFGCEDHYDHYQLINKGRREEEKPSFVLFVAWKMLKCVLRFALWLFLVSMVVGIINAIKKAESKNNDGVAANVGAGFGNFTGNASNTTFLTSCYSNYDCPDGYYCSSYGCVEDDDGSDTDPALIIIPIVVIVVILVIACCRLAQRQQQNDLMRDLLNTRREQRRERGQTPV